MQKKKIYWIGQGRNKMIIGISGKKRSGKDTTAGYFKQFGFAKYSLADPMKDVCRIVFDFDDKQLYGDEKEVIDPRYGISPRAALQDLGTDWAQFGLCERHEGFKKTVGRSIWVKRFINIRNKQEQNAKFVIPDIRFQHEIEELSKLKEKEKVVIIRVTRPSLVSKDEHYSESGIQNLVGVDYDVINDGTVEQLYGKLDDIFKGKI